MEKKDLVHNRNKRYLSPPSHVLGEDTRAAPSSLCPRHPSVMEQRAVVTLVGGLVPTRRPLPQGRAGGNQHSPTWALWVGVFLPPPGRVEDTSSGQLLWEAARGLLGLRVARCGCCGWSPAPGQGWGAGLRLEQGARGCGCLLEPGWLWKAAGLTTLTTLGCPDGQAGLPV